LRRFSVNKNVFFAVLFVFVFIAAPVIPTGAYAALKKGQPAPPIKVVTLSGQSVTLANYRGYVLLLDFFASWCHPCNNSILHLVEINQRYGRDGLQILGLSLDEDRDELIDFIRPLKVNYPVALADEELQIRYGLRSIPTVFLINKRGIIVDIFLGNTDDSSSSLETSIKKLLAE
jgi:cytochrome c biogenesis protein CcmG/thiol:disulfide interchange protein DsbE